MALLLAACISIDVHNFYIIHRQKKTEIEIETETDKKHTFVVYLPPAHRERRSSDSDA